MTAPSPACPRSRSATNDELVEITPQSIRLRKRALSEHDRRREKGKGEGLRRSAVREAAAC